VLVCTQTIQDAEEMESQLARLRCSARAITAKNAFAEAEVMRFAGEAGTVTVAARMAARGVDIVVDDAGRAKGGLAIIAVGHFIYRRLDEQLAGRTGRQGEEGDVQFFVSMEDETCKLTEKFRRFMEGLGVPDGEDLDVPPNLNHTISTFQARQRDMHLANLWTWVRRDEILGLARDEYERKRRQILTASALEPVVQATMKEAIVHARSNRGHWIWTQQDMAPWLDRRDDDAQQAAATLLGIYRERKFAAGPQGEQRERAILLAALDFQWALLYKDWNRHCELSGEFRAGLFHDYRFLSTRTPSFHAEFAEQAVFYLLAIDQDQVLSRCFFWRGTVIPVMATSPNASKGPSSSEEQSAIEEMAVPAGDGKKAGSDAWGGVKIPEDQVLVVPSGFGSSPLDRDALPAQRPRSGTENGGSTLSALNARNRQTLRLTSVATAIASLLLGWMVTYFLVRTTPHYLSWDAKAEPIGFMDSLRGVALLFGGYFRPDFIVVSTCVLTAVVLEEIGQVGFIRFLIPVSATLAAGLGIKFYHLPWSSLIAALVWSIGTVIAYAFVRQSGMRFREAVCMAVGISLLPGVLFQPSAPTASLALLALGLASLGALSAVRFDLKAVRGWDSTDGAANQARSRNAVYCLDDLWPFMAAWVWSGLALNGMSPLMARFAVTPVSANHLIWLGAFVVSAAWVGIRRNGDRFAPEPYRQVAWRHNGVLERNGIPASAESLASMVRKRSIAVWTAAAIAVGGTAFSCGDTTSSFWLVVGTAAVAISLIRAFQHIADRYLGVSEMESESLSSSGGTDFKQLVDRVVRRNGGWWFWGAAMLFYAAQKLAVR
jgi:hypothetical protein